MTHKLEPGTWRRVPLHQTVSQNPSFSQQQSQHAPVRSRSKTNTNKTFQTTYPTQAKMDYLVPPSSAVYKPSQPNQGYLEKQEQEAFQAFLSKFMSMDNSLKTTEAEQDREKQKANQSSTEVLLARPIDKIQNPQNMSTDQHEKRRSTRELFRFSKQRLNILDKDLVAMRHYINNNINILKDLISQTLKTITETVPKTKSQPTCKSIQAQTESIIADNSYCVPTQTYSWEFNQIDETGLQSLNRDLSKKLENLTLENQKQVFALRLQIETLTRKSQFLEFQLVKTKQHFQSQTVERQKLYQEQVNSIYQSHRVYVAKLLEAENHRLGDKENLISELQLKLAAKCQQIEKLGSNVESHRKNSTKETDFDQFYEQTLSDDKKSFAGDSKMRRSHDTVAQQEHRIRKNSVSNYSCSGRKSLGSKYRQQASQFYHPYPSTPAKVDLRDAMCNSTLISDNQVPHIVVRKVAEHSSQIVKQTCPNSRRSAMASVSACTTPKNLLGSQWSKSGGFAKDFGSNKSTMILSRGEDKAPQLQLLSAKIAKLSQQLKSQLTHSDKGHNN